MGTLTITGGTLRSRRVPTPPGRAVRPTPSRVKEALFSILASRLADATVLDLFAGSGALGFEALSRGAAAVTFVESDARTAQALRDTASVLGLSPRVTVHTAPALRAVSRIAGRYDLVFADPPYAQPYPADVFAALNARGAIDAATTIVYEHAARTPAPADAAMIVERCETYGEVALAFLHPAAVPA
jgi:16S rRNA (guanine966-N2)-methyltransferase